jgi:hypothetical protein
VEDELQSDPETSSTRFSSLGLSATDFAREIIAAHQGINIARLVHAPRISSRSVECARYIAREYFEWRSSKVVGDYLPPPGDCALLLSAANLQGDVPMPLWEAVLRRILEHPEWLESSLLSVAGVHDRLPDVRSDLPRTVVLRGALASAAAECRDNQIVVLTSELEMTDGSVAHIPMLDFACPDSEQNLRVVERVLAELGEPGAILASGSSFHFYGSQPLTEPERIRFLARALLFAPIVDSRWVAHDLLERASSLRISRHERTHEYPFVLAVVSAETPSTPARCASEALRG